MRIRILTAVLVLCVVLAAIWETRRRAPPSVIAPAAPPVATPAAPPSPPPLTRKRPPRFKEKFSPPPKKTSASPKKPSASPAPALPIPPPIPYVPPAPAAPEPKEWTGNNDTSITHSGQIVIQNDVQWVRFWAEHRPHEAAPEVDFSQSMVVGVFLGQRPADGFRVVITGARTVPDAVIVDYIELAPPPGTFQVAVEAFPYDIKVIPRSSLRVKFNQLTAQYQKSSPPLGSR